MNVRERPLLQMFDSQSGYLSIANYGGLLRCVGRYHPTEHRMHHLTSFVLARVLGVIILIVLAGCGSDPATPSVSIEGGSSGGDPVPGSNPPVSDTKVPAVSLTAPEQNSTVSGTVTISATASDDVGVAGVRFLLGGASIGSEDTSAPFTISFNSTQTGNDTYTLVAVARDAAGNSTTSVSRTITISNAATVPPAPEPPSPSDPLPPSEGKITSFQLSSDASGAAPFTVGLAFRKGDVPDAPSLDVSGAQVVVKSRWNDGSVKHAIASGEVPLSAGTPLTIGVSATAAALSGASLTSSDIQQANPAATVQLGAIGTASLSTLLSAPFRTWISGPEMVEAHYRSTVGSDNTLAVWFYVRLYKSGRMWIRTVVENGFLDIPASNMTYVPTVKIGGATVYTNGGASLTHYAHTRWTAEGWVGGATQITPRHDTEYLIKTSLVPNYWKRNPSSTTLNGLSQSYTPYQRGGWTQNMGNTGFQDQIGLLPLWDALYLTSGGDARAYRSVIANAKALNSYPIVWNDSATKLPVMPTNRPSWTVYGPDGGGDTVQEAGSLVWDVAHHGSGGYLAYLISGDYFFLETMQDQSSLCYLINSSSHGAGTLRIFGGQTRALAWCTRTVGQLAAVGPSDAVTNDYRTLLASNFSHWQNEIGRTGQNSIGYLYSGEIGYGTYGNGAVSPWQQHFMVQTNGYLSDLEPLPNMTALNAVRNFLYKSVVGILGSVGTSEYCYMKASNYTLTISSSNDEDSTSWFDSWGTVYQATNGTANTSCGTTLEGNSGGDPASASTGYWGNLLPAIAYAVDDGAPNAAAAWSRMTGAVNWTTIEQSGFEDVPIWGIVPRP
jgi:hypothetical protein